MLGRNIGFHGALCSTPIDLIRNMTISEKKNVWTFDPTTGVEGVCVMTEYVFACCCIHHSL